MDINEPFIHKNINFRFNRQTLHFASSQSLFSSFDIDIGTRFLLKTIAQMVDLSQVKRVLDVGCGLGVLGLALKKAHPDIAVTLQDRDALAVAFSQMNAENNALMPVTTQGLLGLEPEGEPFDLIVSNLPGKVSKPVLTHMLGCMAGRLTASGRAAVVIVKPLASFVAQTLVQQESEILRQEKGKGHTVFHFRGGQAPPAGLDRLRPYVRGHVQFKMAKLSMTLQTVFGLPEFDTVGYGTSLLAGLLQKLDNPGRVLIYNPGQGHIPLYLHRRNPASHTTLASRDLLSLHVSQANLQAHGLPQHQLTLQHIPHIGHLQDTFDTLIIFPDHDPGVPWDKDLPLVCDRLLAPAGHALISAKSTFIFRLLENRPRALRKRFDKKKKGFRTIVWRKTKDE